MAIKAHQDSSPFQRLLFAAGVIITIPITITVVGIVVFWGGSYLGYLALKDIFIHE